MSAPAELAPIADALAAMTVPERAALARRAGVRPASAHLLAAASGRTTVRPYDAADVVQIAAALNIDLLTGQPLEMAPAGGPLLWEHLACAVKLARYAAKLSTRKAAKQWGIEATALNRVENAIPVSIAPLLDICGALGRHPFEFLQPILFHGEHKLQQSDKKAETVNA